MLITYHGHAEFSLEMANGFTLITDPFDGHVGYEMKTCPCDAVTVSHGHGDHNHVEKLTGDFAVVDAAGIWQVSPEVTVEAIVSVHDEEGGKKRGSNLIMKIMAEGLTVVHLGDQGDSLTEEQLRRIGKADVLMVPVGGFYTVDAEKAAQITEKIGPRVVIPMHYKTQVNKEWPITDEKPFLARMGKKDLQPMPLLRITKGDLSQQPSLVLLQHEA